MDLVRAMTEVRLLACGRVVSWGGVSVTLVRVGDTRVPSIRVGCLQLGYPWRIDREGTEGLSCDMR